MFVFVRLSRRASAQRHATRAAPEARRLYFRAAINMKMDVHKFIRHSVGRLASGLHYVCQEFKHYHTENVYRR